MIVSVSFFPRRCAACESGFDRTVDRIHGELLFSSRRVFGCKLGEPASAVFGASLCVV